MSQRTGHVAVSAWDETVNLMIDTNARIDVVDADIELGDIHVGDADDDIAVHDTDAGIDVDVTGADTDTNDADLDIDTDINVILTLIPSLTMTLTV